MSAGRVIFGSIVALCSVLTVTAATVIPLWALFEVWRVQDLLAACQ